MADSGLAGSVRWVALVATVAGASALAAPVVAASSPQPGLSEAWQQVVALLALSHQRSPAAVVVGAFGLGLPVVGLVVMLTRRWLRRRSRRRQFLDARPAIVGSGRGAAWLELVDSRQGNVRLAAELHRIGRDEDNEVTITGPGILGTHAVIRRTPEREFVLFDVSGGAGAALLINGAPCAVAALADGDRISLGGARAIFRSAEPGAILSNRG